MATATEADRCASDLGLFASICNRRHTDVGRLRAINVQALMNPAGQGLPQITEVREEGREEGRDDAHQSRPLHQRVLEESPPDRPLNRKRSDEPEGRGAAAPPSQHPYAPTQPPQQAAYTAAAAAAPIEAVTAPPPAEAARDPATLPTLGDMRSQAGRAPYPPAAYVATQAQDAPATFSDAVGRMLRHARQAQHTGLGHAPTEVGYRAEGADPDRMAKHSLLHELNRLRLLGIPATRHFTMQDTASEMEYELRKGYKNNHAVTTIRRWKSWIKFGANLLKLSNDRMGPLIPMPDYDRRVTQLCDNDPEFTRNLDACYQLYFRHRKESPLMAVGMALLWPLIEGIGLKLLTWVTRRRANVQPEPTPAGDAPQDTEPGAAPRRRRRRPRRPEDMMAEEEAEAAQQGHTDQAHVNAPGGHGALLTPAFFTAA